MENKKLIAEYNWINNDVYLIAEVNKSDGRQLLRMQLRDYDTIKLKIPSNQEYDVMFEKHYEKHPNDNISFDQFKNIKLIEMANRKGVLIDQMGLGYKLLIEDDITCIHTAVMDIPLESLENAKEYLDMEKKSFVIEDLRDLDSDEIKKKSIQIRSRSTENMGLKEINLAIPEKFKAFCIWVGGIADAGLDAFRVQSDIEEQANIQNPIANKLMTFYLKVNPNFVKQYMAKVKKDCVFEGKIHINSVKANMISIFQVIYHNRTFIQDGTLTSRMKEIMQELYDWGFPLSFFSKNSDKYPLLHKEFLIMVKTTTRKLFREEREISQNYLNGLILKKQKTLLLSNKYAGEFALMEFLITELQKNVVIYNPIKLNSNQHKVMLYDLKSILLENDIEPIITSSKDNLKEDDLIIVMLDDEKLEGLDKSNQVWENLKWLTQEDNNLSVIAIARSNICLKKKIRFDDVLITSDLGKHQKKIFSTMGNLLLHDEREKVQVYFDELKFGEYLLFRENLAYLLNFREFIGETDDDDDFDEL